MTTDVFTFKHEGKNILYAPLLGFACEANDDLILFLADLATMDDRELNDQEKKILQYLMDKGIVDGESHPEKIQPSAKEPCPSKLTLFPTNQCNMRCRYCYASAGTMPPMTMDWETATSAIDYFTSFLKKKNRIRFPLEFHGGGEPLYAWSLVTGIIEYAEDECGKAGLELDVYAGTNGVLTEKQCHWIIEHFHSLNVSFEGLPHVQDFHRPMATGKGSFNQVDATLKRFDTHNFPYGIRCTVSSYNENILTETIHYITENYKTKLIWLEPLYLCERHNKQEEDLKPDFERFVENFKALEPICTRKGVFLKYSGATFEKITSTFCSVGTDDFAITPDGYLTNCWEVTYKDHPLADTFIIGRMRPEGRIEIDQKKLNHLRSLSVHALPFCRDCFAKYHCAGDCPTKLDHNHYQGDRGGPRCETNRRLIAHRISQLLVRTAFYEKESVVKQNSEENSK